jgi:hypothetical protein
MERLKMGNRQTKMHYRASHENAKMQNSVTSLDRICLHGNNKAMSFMKTMSLHWDFLWWNFSEMTTLVWCISKLSAFLIFLFKQPVIGRYISSEA